ncbi:MAG TPA: bifunctional phosphopantothenoylcysteine decarboxylase/phosphopantothenate--cysteine ligase CoaBC [Gammaproteobacteria bacterium]|nr:bifunctional phosphopantothenoylcysteine decarboxylase/phosphopantothenate--cysteine ligase CoaBC [Gammaproteobacteria bacterium]
MNTLANKHILIGVTGGIAAYKSAELVRRLREREVNVKVVMTRSACAFIGPLTMQALSDQPVHIELLDPGTESVMGHIELARWCDAVLVAPASANFLAKLAHGLADDLLSTLCLATTAPIVVAPAMNQQMWQAQATQSNRAVLESRGVRFFGPAEGGQACGEVGPGRMLEPAAIIEALARLFHPGTLTGVRILVTAGPTREAIDPVRFISNRSSGRMGYAIAQAAMEAGAKVVLVSGPVALSTPRGVERIAVETAEEMREAVMARIQDCDLFIAAAAVADYRCQEPASQKLKKAVASITLTLERTPDVLAQVASQPKPPFTVGFYAETENLEKNALDKLVRKSLDMIVANEVGWPGVGFESDENALSVFWKGGKRELSRALKAQLARDLVEIIAQRYRERDQPL